MEQQTNETPVAVEVHSQEEEEENSPLQSEDAFKKEKESTHEQALHLLSDCVIDSSDTGNNGGSNMPEGRKSKRQARTASLSNAEALKSKRMCYDSKPVRTFSRMRDLITKISANKKRTGSSGLDNLRPSTVKKQLLNSSNNVQDDSNQGVSKSKLKDSMTHNENEQTEAVEVKYDYRELIDAVKIRDYNKVILLLQSSKHDYALHPDTLDKALWFAVFQEDLFLVKKLVFHNAKAVEVNKIHCFLFAAEKGLFTIVEHLVSHYEGLVNIKNSSGYTALHLCQMNSNSAPITKALIAAGADLSVIGIGGGGMQSVLELALEHRNLNSLLQLIRAGANVDIKKLKDYSRSLGLANIVDVRFEGPKQNNLSPVMKAIVSQNVELLELLLMSDYFDINDCDENGETPLLMVFHMKGDGPDSMCKQPEVSNIESNNEEKNKINLELSNNVNIETSNVPNEDASESFILDSNKENLTKEMSETKSEQKCSTDKTFTHNQWMMIELLLKAGSRISFDGKYRKESHSPLLLTLEKGDHHLLQFLIDRQRCVEYDEDWSEALGMTIENGRLDLIQVLAPVLQKLTTLKSYNPLDFEKTLHVGIQRGYVKCVSKLLDMIKGYDYIKAVSVAATAGQLKILKLLQGQVPDKFQELVQSDVGTQWLCNACDSNNFSCINFFLSFGVDVNGSDAFDDHPIVHCKLGRNLDLLLEHDVDWKRRTRGRSYGCLVLEKALNKNHIETVTNMILKGAPTDAGVIACALNLGDHFYDAAFRKVKCLVLESVNNYALNRQSENPINAAIEKGDQFVLEILLQNKLDPNHHLDSEEHPLLKAVIPHKARYNRREIVKLLLAHGANIDITNGKGDTALHLLILSEDNYDNYKIASNLIKHNVNLNAINKQGFTAVMIAAEKEDRDTLITLIKGGADLNVVRAYDNTTVLTQYLNRAYYNREAFILNVLISNGAVTAGNISGAVHRCVADKEYQTLRVMTSSGYFTPVLLEESYKGCMIKNQYIDKFKGVLSPMCMAVLCGQVVLAQDMLDMLFVTSSDLQLLAKHVEVRAQINEFKLLKSLKFLDDLSTKPPSLMQISFALVSDKLGDGPQRKESVKKLGLPGALQRALLFSNKSLAAQEKQNRKETSLIKKKNDTHPDKYEYFEMSDYSDNDVPNNLSLSSNEDDDIDSDVSNVESDEYESDVGTLNDTADKEDYNKPMSESETEDES